MNYIIILLNYNNWQDTLECVRSLEESGIDAGSILVVENSSTDDSYKCLKESLGTVTLLKTDQNLGFSGGNNFGIRHALKSNPQYIILLNNDTLVNKDSIRILVDEMNNYPEASLGTGQIRYYPETDKIWYAGGKLNKWRGLAVHLHENEYAGNLPVSNEPSFVSFISGCYLCIRTSMMGKTGLLNEKFFLYHEDIEFSARAVRNGLKLLYVPASVIYHKCRGERKLRERTLYYAVRNRNLLIDMCFPFVAKIYFFFVIRAKMLIWFFRDKELFHAAQVGLKDYKKDVFGQVRI
jgi:GT2 family glycosyltransferase